MAYKTPGVYVDEVSTLPPSVAEVATAIPAFVGYTAKGEGVHRIKNFVEYQDLFGGPPSARFSVTTAGGQLQVTRDTDDHHSKFLMYYAMNLFFRNGGGPCYVSSAGNYSAAPAKDKLETGLEALRSFDEPTLLIVPEAMELGADAYPGVYETALKQCGELGDRFCILDVPDGTLDKVNEFRSLGSPYLMFGAAYYPFLRTSLAYAYEEKNVTVDGGPMNDLKPRTAIYNQVKAALAREYVTLPSSAAMAGIYSRVDRERGVWKAPANEPVQGVLGPSQKITDNDQAGMNVDPTAGKSINAIRAFTGKGTLVWGARTLAGNDNEWRYISVRRLFNMIEESAKKSTGFAVFEPNDANTWLKVKAMIEAYLHGLWEQGALMGSKADDAYFVSVGLGKTMTTQDVLEGRMIVEIGIAAVRPAEFIILKFSHHMQAS